MSVQWRLKPDFAAAISMLWAFLRVMNSLVWRSAIWRPGKLKDVPLDRGALVAGQGWRDNHARPRRLNRSACGHFGIRCA